MTLCADFNTYEHTTWFPLESGLARETMVTLVSRATPLSLSGSFAYTELCQWYISTCGARAKILFARVRVLINTDTPAAILVG